jgi:membrane protein implicated in regulation of membrane protease activity
MDMNLLYAILIALVPVVLTIILSKVYNIVHGLITFLVSGFVLFFCLEAFNANLPAEIVAYLIPGKEGAFATCELYYAINSFVISALNQLGLADFLAWEGAAYCVLGAYVLVFIISQIVSSVVRKKRIEKEKKMKRQLKRY